MHGPQQSYSQEVMRNNHRLPGEDFREGVNRISAALSDSDEHFRKIRDIGMDRRFLFGGRIQASAGSSKNTTMHNCFVSGTIGDSLVEGDGSIAQRAVEAMTTMRMGGGIGYDFSTLRPRGSDIKRLGSTSSGPLAFLKWYNAGGQCIASSGHRRGAQMGVMRVDHPDIEEFIKVKQTAGDMLGFNLSVAITDEFMEHLSTGRPFTLRWGGQSYSEVDPHDLWEAIMRGTWDYAEPGVLFIDQINRMNNLWYCEKIAATNPCGEQPLPPFGACLLGSINLPMYLQSHEHQVISGETTTVYSLDIAQIEEDMPHIVRSLDMVNDLSHYPLPQQADEALSKRRMGIGVTGLANAIEACGPLYGDPEFLSMQEEILRRISDAAYMASAMLAREKGAFPLYDERLLESGFMTTRDEGLREVVRECGLRNSHLTSIAPTGSISFGLGDNVSSSIEPVFSYEQERTVLEADGSRVDPVTDWGFRELGVRGRRTRDVTVAQHLSVLATAQMHVDSAVSKTINMDSSVSWRDFNGVYMRAWEMGAKGCTTYRKDGKREGVIRDTDADSSPAPEFADGTTCMVMADGTRSCE